MEQAESSSNVTLSSSPSLQIPQAQSSVVSSPVVTAVNASGVTHQPENQAWWFGFTPSSRSVSVGQHINACVPSSVTSSIVSSAEVRSVATASHSSVSVGQHINACVPNSFTSNNVVGATHQPASSAFDFSRFGRNLPTAQTQRPILSHRVSAPVYTPMSRGVFLGEDDVQRRFSREPSRVKKEVRIEVPPTQVNFRAPPLVRTEEEEEEDYWFGYVDANGGYRPMSEQQEQLYRASLSRQRAGLPPQRDDPPPAVIIDPESHVVEQTPRTGRCHQPRQLVLESSREHPSREDPYRWYQTRSRSKGPRFKTGDDFDVFLMKFQSWLKRENVVEDLGEELLAHIDCNDTYKRVRRLRLSVEEQRDPELMTQAVRSAVVHRVKDEEAERRKLMQMKQNVGESVEEFADRIREVAEYAFPGASDREVNQRMIEALQDGLIDTRVSELVCDLRSCEIDFEKVVVQAAKRWKRNRMFRGDVYVDPSSAVHDRENVFRLANSNTTAAVNNTPSPAAVQTTSSGPANPSLCSKCGKRGHTETNCWASMKCQLCETQGHTAHQCARFRDRNNGAPRTTNRGPRQRPEVSRNGSGRGQGCFECGSPAHRVAQCPVRAVTIQCYSCYQFGHRAVECPQFQGNGGAIGGYPAAVGRQ